MASMTFQVNDGSTSTGAPAVWVTITENANGTLSFTVTQQGGIIGDLRGIFFDLNDESVRSSLSVTSTQGVTEFKTGDDSVKDLGDGANMNGLLGSDKGYDAGIEIGSSGIGKDDIQSYSFTLSSSARPLTLTDFANVDFGVRLTSVGTIGGSRDDSSKIMETTSAAIDAKDDAGQVYENQTASGNVLANDTTGGGTSTVTSWDGGALGQAVELSNSEGVTLTLNADGSWSLDASEADALSEGEHLTYTFHYAARNQTEATSWSDDSAAFTVTVHGVNDGPDANDDSAGRIFEDETLSGSVVANDEDVDRLDTHTWSLVDGSFNGQGNLVFNDDGTWSYDANGAYDSLLDGDEVALQFQYTMTDNHGASDTAWVSFIIDGTGEGNPPPPPPPPVDPEVDFLFNHGTKQMDHGFFPQLSDGNDKTNIATGFTDNDTLKLAGFGDLDSITITEGDYGLGDPDIADTQFTMEINGNPTSTRTEDVGYLADYTGIEADQIDVTSGGQTQDSYTLIFA